MMRTAFRTPGFTRRYLGLTRQHVRVRRGQGARRVFLVWANLGSALVVLPLFLVEEVLVEANGWRPESGTSAVRPC